MKTPNDLFNNFLTKIGEDIFGKVKILDTVNTNLTNTEIDVNVTNSDLKVNLGEDIVKTEIQNTNLNIVDTNSDDYKLKNGKKFMVSGYATGTTLNAGIQILNSVGKKLKINVTFLMSASCDIFVNKNSIFNSGTPGIILGYQKDNIQNGLPSGLDVVLKWGGTSLNATGNTIYKGFYGSLTQTDNNFNQDFILNPTDQITIYGISSSGSSTFATFELDIEVID